MDISCQAKILVVMGDAKQYEHLFSGNGRKKTYKRIKTIIKVMNLLYKRNTNKVSKLPSCWCWGGNIFIYCL